MRQRGFGLIFVMFMAATLSVLAMAAFETLSRARYQVQVRKDTAAAQAMADSGAAYAQAMLAAHKWKAPLEFQSPDFQSGRFHVSLTGRLVRATGQAGTVVRVVEKKLP